MSEKRRSPRYWKSHTDTILGPGVRVDGTIRYSGVLRSQGEILGDVLPASDAGGSVVISKSGSVSGTIKANNVVVCGQVQGNTQASESVEVQGGASIVGSVSYRSLVILPGGIVEGALTPVAAPADQNDRQGSSGQPGQMGAPGQAPVPGSGGGAGWLAAPDRRKIAMVAAVVVAAMVLVWASRRSTVDMPPAAEEPPAAMSAQPAAPADGAGDNSAASLAGEAKRVVVEGPSLDEARSKKAEPKAAEPVAAMTPVPTAPPAPTPVAAREAVETPAHAIAAAGDGEVIAVQGDDPEKSNDFVYVACDEPCVLIKKGRQDAGAGTRIALPKNGRKRIGIAPDDILRVAEGQDVDAFFQGRKVARQTLLSGVWLSFVAKPAQP